MSPTNCWNLRVTAEVNQGGRKYMEDVTSVQFERVKSGKVVVEYAAFAIFDGHGGKDAAHFARDHLLENIKVQKGFFSNDIEVVKKAISDAFVATHLAMWNKLPEWPKTSLGHPSTAGTTASLCIIRGNRMYVANVGDSMIVMGSKDIEKPNSQTKQFIATDLTIDHKPELLKERKRIERCGGCVMNKSGVNRVVWARPKINHTGPIRRSTKLDKIPFLAVARSLGDLWSFNSELNEFVVSPVPDVYVYNLHKNKEQFLILASDGLWNMIRPQEAVSVVAMIESKHNKLDTGINPAHRLVQIALDRWQMRMMRADNTSVIVVVIERKKVESARKKETYFESWTSAKDENAPVTNKVQVKEDPKTESDKPIDPTAEGLFDSSKDFYQCSATTSKTLEPLQDSSISSSSGEAADEVESSSPSKVRTRQSSDNQPSSSGIKERIQTRSQSVNKRPIRKAAKRRQTMDNASIANMKTRRMSIRKPPKRRAKSEGGTAKSMITPTRNIRSRKSKKSL